MLKRISPLKAGLLLGLFIPSGILLLIFGDLVLRPASFNTNEWLETEHFKECQGKKQMNWPS
jgi:hypothetical protein